MNKTGFRFKDDSSDETWKKGLKAYISFLRENEDNIDSDLLRYFGLDFFHDGTIEDMSVSSDFKEVSFRILGPNMQIERDDGEREYVNAWFRCYLHDVAHMEMFTIRHDDFNDPLKENEFKPVKYLHSEINSLSDEIDHYHDNYGREFQSLIILTTPHERYFAFVFDSMTVEPEEPLAFELFMRDSYNKGMLYNSDFDISEIDNW